MPTQNPKRILRRIGFILLFTLIIGYAIWQSRDLLFGIRLKVIGITDGESFHDSVVTISGTSYHAVKVTIQDSVVPVSEKGDYTGTIALLPGYNIVSVSATDRFGKTITHIFHTYYVYTPPVEPIPEEKAEEKTSKDPVSEEHPSTIQ